jgi:hypothetical protein
VPPNANQSAAGSARTLRIIVRPALQSETLEP